MTLLACSAGVEQGPVHGEGRGRCEAGVHVHDERTTRCHSGPE